jgi:hypothetical protein
MTEQSNNDFYTEKATNLIYQAKFFEDFVIARPVSPMFYRAIRKLSLVDFSKEFHEFLGDPQEVRQVIDTEITPCVEECEEFPSRNEEPSDDGTTSPTT